MWGLVLVTILAVLAIAGVVASTAFFWHEMSLKGDINDD